MQVHAQGHRPWWRTCMRRLEAGRKRLCYTRAHTPERGTAGHARQATFAVDAPTRAVYLDAPGQKILTYISIVYIILIRGRGSCVQSRRSALSCARMSCIYLTHNVPSSVAWHECARASPSYGSSAYSAYAPLCPRSRVCHASRLTPKQQRFVDAYILSLNATQAYREAGYRVTPANVAAVKRIAC